MYRAFGNMLNSIVSNSQFGKRPGARDMTIFGFHVGLILMILDIWKHMGAHEVIWSDMKVGI